MGFPQARVTDMHGCLLPVPPSPVPTPPPGTPLPILPPCSPNVLVGTLMAARVGDMVTAPVPAPHPIAKGSATVLINNMMAARVMDTCGCGGMIMKGEPTVIVGG